MHVINAIRILLCHKINNLAEYEGSIKVPIRLLPGLPLAALAVERIERRPNGGNLKWTQDEQGLSVNLPEKPPSQNAVTLKIHGLPTV